MLSVDVVMGNKILVIEDDDGIRKFLGDLLVDNDFYIETARDCSDALRLLKISQQDLLVLDLDQSITSRKMCLDIKKKYPVLPIIILATKDNISEAKNKFELSNNDYVLKPFVAEDLLVLIKERLKDSDKTKLNIADLEINSKTFEVKRGGKLIKLSPHEFKLLQYLLSNKGRVLSREMILNKVWLYSLEIDTRVVDVYIGYLRRKIDSKFDKKLIQSVRGFGYMIKE